MERAGIKAPSRCKSGSCGFCHSRLVRGEYFVDTKHEYRRQADLKFGYIHPCCTYPESDMEIDVPPFNVGGNK
jgi:ferredoxin